MCVVLFIDILVVWVDSSMVISSLNGVVYFSLVVGVGLVWCRCLKILWCLVGFIVVGCWVGGWFVWFVVFLGVCVLWWFG